MSILQDCQSIEQVAQVINTWNEEGNITVEAAEIAGEYATDAASDAGDGYSRGNLSAHLDALTAAGADFNFHTAILYARKLSRELIVDN